MDNENKEKNDKEQDRGQIVLSVVLVFIGLMLTDVSGVLGLLLIFAGLFVVPRINAKKLREASASGDLGETVKTVLNEVKQSLDEDDDEDDDEDEDEDGLPKKVTEEYPQQEDMPNRLPDGDDEQEPASLSKRITESKKDEELKGCEADHVHAEKYRDLSDDDKRREQLKGMLSAGLIDREEYVIMLKKYGLK